MARTKGLPMKPGKKRAIPTPSRRSKRESRQFVPFAGEDFTVKKESKKKGGKKEEKRGKKTRPDGIKKVAKGIGKKKEEKKGKKVKEPKVSKKGNDRLVPRNGIKFGREHGSLSLTSYVSLRSFSRQLFAAVMRADVKGIEKLYKDTRVGNDVALLHYSDMDNRSPITLALELGNEKVISTLIKCHQSREGKKEDGVVAEPNLLKRKSAGRRNIHMLGRMTRAIESSRGGREGNNAFLNYGGDEDGSMSDTLLEYLDFTKMSYPFLSQFALPKKGNGNAPIFSEPMIQNRFMHALRAGNRSLASDIAQLGSHNFNTLQLESLKPNGKYPKQIMAISVRKRCFIYRNITPAHTAAINPDPAFLAALRDVDPMVNVPDQNNWYTMHYAAACEGDGPLKFLLSKDVGVCDVNKQGEMPLHIAAKNGRVDNVKVLLEAIAKMENKDGEKENEEEEEEEEEEDEDGAPKAKRAKKAAKPGPIKSIANAKTRRGRTALHYAIWNGRKEVVKLMLANKSVDKDCPNSANDKKLTPLMIAIGRGHLEIAEMLIEAGCLVEGRDKLKRSPLMIATINGHANIAAMLLQKGADVKRKDSSGNTALHYACAYGWIEIAKMIVEIDKETLEAKNEWLITPLSIAYLKGHYGIVSWLLEDHSDMVDVNCKDNEGITLISSLLSYHDEDSTAHLPDQIDYLIKHGVDCSITDTAGNSPLHIFSSVPLILRVEKPTRVAEGNGERITSAQYKKCIDQLIGAKADPLGKNAEGDTPFTVALSSGNLYLASLLMDSYGQLLLQDEGIEDYKTNVMHTLLTLPQTVLSNRSLWAYADAPIGGQYNIVPLLKKMQKVMGEEWMERVLKGRDQNGNTPVLMMTEFIASMSNSSNMDIGQFAAFAATVMAGLRECLKMRPESVLDRVKRKPVDNDETPDEERDSVMKTAMGAGRGGGNKMMEALLLSAAENGNLHSFLTERMMTEEARGCAVSPLIVALLKKKEVEAILILRAAKEAGIVEEICGAKIETRPKKKEGDEEEESGRENGVEAKRNGEPWNKTAFHIAIHHSLHQTLGHFVLSERQAAEVDADGRNAWHYAAHSLTHSTIKNFQLLEEKRVPMVANSLGQRPLHVAVNAERTGSADAFLDPIEWLMEREEMGKEDIYGSTALHYAFEKLDVKGKAKEMSKQDPIAVVSLLIGGMDKDTIRHADHRGNTALHLAARADANICAVTLLSKGAEVDALNGDGNSPLALAILAKSQAAALTLIQAGADVNGPIVGPEPEEVKEKKYRFNGEREEKRERLRSAIPDEIVRNEWHSLVYVLIGKGTPGTIVKLVAAALANGQHNFALYLLKILGKPGPEAQAAMAHHDFLSLYTGSLRGQLVGPALTVLEKILELNVPFIDARGRSPVIEKACRNGHYLLIEKLQQHDPTGFRSLCADQSGTSPIQALIMRWIGHKEERKEIKKALENLCFAGILNLEQPIAVPVKGLRGVRPNFSSSSSTTDRDCIITPLCAAIKAQDEELVQYLVTEWKVNVNKASPERPILEAVITNNNKVIKALVDGEVDSASTVAVNGFAANKQSKKRVMMGGFGAKAPMIRVVSQEVGDETEEEEDSEEEEEEEEENEEEEEEQTEEAPSTTKLDLKGKMKGLDMQGLDSFLGRNVAHYLVEPCGWQNVELLEALLKAYKQEFTPLLTKPDHNGDTPISLAAKRNQHAMFAAMSKYAKRSNNVELAGLEVEVPPMTNLNVKEDSEALIKEFAEKQAKKKEGEKISRAPNKKSTYQKTGEIVECPETNQLMRVMMNKTDLRMGLYGFHNYYRMELIKRKDADLYILFTNWGRIGDSHGEFQTTPFNSLEAGMKEFKSVFKQKSGNEWCKLENFVEKQGKYRLTKTNDTVMTMADIEIDNFKLREEDKGDEVMEFLADICNVRQLRSYAHSVQLSNNSRVACPFGRVEKGEIEKARQILFKLAAVLEDATKARDQRPPNMEKIFKLTDQQYLLTSEFYTTIPVGGYDSSAIRVIDSPSELQSAYEILNTIGEIEIAGRLVAAARYNQIATRGEDDPLHYISSALDCTLTVAPPEGERVQRLMQWIGMSRRGVEIDCIYNVNSVRAAQAMQQHLDCSNTTYLFHGTKPQNLLSILHYGLKATPANALQCGQAFGNGVYFADAFEKSAGYCTTSERGMNYMLVCKVALGKVCEKETIELKDKFDTRKVKGAKEISGGLTIDGAMMPLGPMYDPRPEERRHWYAPQWNEYIVKEESRILPVMLIAYK